MAYQIIDRRKNDKNKSSTNRSRYIRRVREQVKESVKNIIRDGSIKENLGGGAKKVRIHKKDLTQPQFTYGKGGIYDVVHPGNKQFQQGDRISKPDSNEGQAGSMGSNTGEDSDIFEFGISKEEFLEIFFEDLELPDMIKKSLAVTTEVIIKRAGFSTDGNPARLNVLRSMKQAKSRRVALRSPKKTKLKELEDQYVKLYNQIKNLNSNDKEFQELNERLTEIELQIQALKRKIKAIPFIDDNDLRYARWERVIIPTTQAVMFGIMDVSGSMGEWEKEMAKRFFMLMLLFLQHNYERVDIVWIRHHTFPKEVDEEEFFYSRDSGGTIVSPALELMRNIINERYPISQWNIFGTQISDGDDWSEDCPISRDVMKEKILPITQYFAYVEVNKKDNTLAVSNTTTSDLWPFYNEIVESGYNNFVMSVIKDVSDIYPVFRKLFEKKKQ